MSRLPVAAVALSILLSVCLLACPAPPEQQQGHDGMASKIVIPPPPAASGTGATALTWQAPAGWIEQTPETSMRKAQYLIDGPGGPARCDVFYFGPGQGGDPESNVQRWAHQFEKEDGSSPFEELLVSELEGAVIPVRIVEITGSYKRSMGSGPGSSLPGYMLLGAIAEGPDAPWFFKFTGSEQTVRPQRQAFEGMLRSLVAGE